MTIDRLRELAPAPQAEPPAIASVRWQEVERLGLAPPTDYKDLLAMYGPGQFADFIFVHSPFAPAGYMNLLSQLELSLEAYRPVREAARSMLPDPAYPERSGLLALGHTCKGDNSSG